MSKLRAFLTILLIAVISSFLAGCRAPDILPPATLVPAPAEEAYELINTADFKMDIQTQMSGRVETDRNGNVTTFGGGKVTVLNIAGIPVALKTVDLVYENQKVYVSTWDYGEILLSFNPDFTLGVWMKPSQMAKIRTALALAQAATPVPPMPTEVFIPWTETPTAVPIPPTSTSVLATATHDPNLGSVMGSVQFENARVPVDQVEVVLVDAKEIDPGQNAMPVGFQILNAISVKEPQAAKIKPDGQFKIDNIPAGKYWLVLRGGVIKTDGFAFCQNDVGPDGWDLVWMVKIDSDGQPILSGDVLAIAFNATSSSTKLTMSGANTLIANIKLGCK